MRLRVKICGITRRADAELAVAAGADAIGFVFWDGSPRRVTAGRVAAIGEGLPRRVARVGVFVDERLERVTGIAASARLTTAQLHGSEDPAYCARVGLDWYRAFRVGPGATAAALAAEVARYGAGPFLLDAAGPVPGGGGRRFEWSLALEVGRLACAGRARLILAGGLTPGNVAEAVRLLRPCGLLGVDVSTGVESAPGVKDPFRVRDFIAAARSVA